MESIPKLIHEGKGNALETPEGPFQMRARSDLIAPLPCVVRHMHNCNDDGRDGGTSQNKISFVLLSSDITYKDVRRGSMSSNFDVTGEYREQNHGQVDNDGSTYPSN